MEPVIVSQNSQRPKSEKPASLSWSARMSLTNRILAVNILAVALLAGSLFYLDNYRNRLIEERLAQAGLQLSMITDSLKFVEADRTAELIVEFAIHLNGRIRVYDQQGVKVLDSFKLAEPTYQLVDPETEPWRKDAARFLDRSVEYIVSANPVKKYLEPESDTLNNWPILKQVVDSSSPTSMFNYAEDRTPVIIAASKTVDDDATILLTSNARDITRIVRAERSSVILVMLTAVIVSVLLSLFLARTIVRPIRKLAQAAVRVRMGREPELNIPKMPERRDEIGQLARALSDMSGALRHRIDATEAFSADVSHEIKNPLASLRSALEGLERLKDPDLQDKLIAVANDDVRRIDRLITDISDASRVDAELARTKFEPVDIGGMIEQLLAARERRKENTAVEIAYARPGRGITTIMGDDGRLERVFSNLLDNAVSFSPAGGLIEIMATPDGEEVIVSISDEGPGVPQDQRDKIFHRFHSDRPVEEEFGRHSGLGLAIAKTIVEGHEGQIQVKNRPDGRRGACFEIRLPKGF